jgi:hypothetical protein
MSQAAIGEKKGSMVSIDGIGEANAADPNIM